VTQRIDELDLAENQQLNRLALADQWSRSH
jgi:hypothetical protein